MLYRPKDFQEGFPPRIMGSETEYNVRHMTDDMNLMPHLPEAEFFRETGRDDGADLWLQNGARLYIDCGGLLEYATPEVENAHRLLEHERAGEAIVQDLADRMYRHLTGDAKVHNDVYKRSGYDIPGRERVTAGHHENYTTSIPDVFGMTDRGRHPLHHALQSYLATRQVWAGAGMLRNGYYALGQKMNTVDFAAKSKTTLEGRKLAYDVKRGSLGQLEIRTADGNMMDWAIVQRYAFTSLVLRMIEHGDFPNRLLIEPGSASSTFQFTNDNQRINLQGTYIKPATHQRLIAQAAIDFIADNPMVPDEEQEAALEILAACRQIEALDSSFDGAEELADRIDWAAKLTLIRQRGIGELTNLNPAALMTDLRWEDIAVNGIARLWTRDTEGSRQVTDGAIELARIMPPPTRALARVALLDRYGAERAGRQEFTAINWSAVEADYTYHSLPDPYQTSPKST